MKPTLIIESTMPHAKFYAPNKCPTICEAAGAGGGHIPIMLFEVETIGHDIRSTQFAKDGHTDPLCNTDYKEPPIVCYEVNDVSIDRQRTITPNVNEPNVQHAGLHA